MWLHKAFIAATSLVPLAGVVWLGWSASTLLAVFWAETLLSGTANVLRIAIHRRLTRASGHWRRHLKDSRAREIQAPMPEVSFLAEYTMILYVFTFAHGLFLGIFLLILDHNWQGAEPSPWKIDVESFRNGVLAVLGITVLELVYEGLSLGRQTFSWLKSRMQASLGRVVVLHLVIIFGAFLMMRFETPMTFLGVLVGLKALIDLGTAGGPVADPAKPPRWLVALARKRNVDMEREWTNILAQQKQQAEEDEKPFSPD